MATTREYRNKRNCVQCFISSREFERENRRKHLPRRRRDAEQATAKHFSKHSAAAQFCRSQNKKRRRCGFPFASRLRVSAAKCFFLPLSLPNTAPRLHLTCPSFLPLKFESTGKRNCGSRSRIARCARAKNPGQRSSHKSPPRRSVRH